MAGTHHTVDATDLLVHGTYALRRALARLARRQAVRVEPAGSEHVQRDGWADTAPSRAAVRSRVSARDRS